MLLKVEGKVNRLLSKLKETSSITENEYNELYASGTNPGILYGLPKVHKAFVPLRPIFSACKTPTFKLAKFLVPILAPFTENEFTVKNSYQFADDMKKMTLDNSMIMASFDVESLFTNIPVRETINICLDLVFNAKESVTNISKALFKSILETAVLNSFFLFNGDLYKQTDGVGMGLPLGPTFANIFLCYHEQRWLQNCPLEFRPICYKRYVDDCFLIFSDRSHIDRFLAYLNSQHPSIRFTKDVENNGCLSFLDINLCRKENKLEMSIYRNS